MSSQRPDPDAVFDPGLQVERTLLAWRRTCLSFGTAGLLGMRFAVPEMGFAAVILGILGAGLSILAYGLASTGYRRADAELRARGRLGRDGRPLLLATVAVLSVGALCAAYLVRGLLGA